jgi:adenylate cyclase
VRNALNRPTLWLFLGVGAVAAAIAFGVQAAGLLRSQEQSTVDVRFSIRGSQGAPSDIRLVEIDATTFSQLRVRWPFPRRLHARVIDELRKAGAKVIAYDIQFTEPTDPRDDLALWNAAARARNVVFATTEVNAKGGTDVLGGDANLRQAHAVAANALIASDAGGVDRKILYQVQGLKTFAVTTAEKASGRTISPSAVPGSGAWIDYVGPPGTIHGLSFSKVYNGQIPKDFFRGKVVVVGPVAPSLQDVHATSVSGNELMSGAEIQGNAIWTALHGFPLRSAGGWLNDLLIIVLAMIVPAIARRLSPLRTLIATLAVGALYAVGVQVAFDHGRVLAFVYPLVGLAFSLFGCLAVGALLEAFERQRIRDVFGRFVPGTVVDEVLAEAKDGLRLSGKLRLCTLLFTDMRGFTTFSEDKPAEEVFNILNFYFGEISQAILDHGGTLVSYLGDGIISVFGAPLDQPDHADRALAASREILLERLPRFNEWIRAQGYGDGFRMGVGLNSGEIMCGTLGSEQRMDYTMIGDAVNTASRLEGMTKGTPFPLFLSDSTRELLTDEPDDLVFVAELEVRGRTEKVKVWSLRSLLGPAPAATQPAPVEGVPAPAPAH